MDRRIIALLGFSAVLAVVVLVIVVGRGGGDDDDGGGEDFTALVEERGKPTVEPPQGPPPKELQIEDIEEGEGDEAQSGGMVTVQYVGVDYDSGKQFDASWDSGQPFPFQLGGGQVIPGWDQGVVGMKEGGRRQLIIPPDLAYGAEGQPPAIKPNATLVFVIDLVEVQ